MRPVPARDFIPAAPVRPSPAARRPSPIVTPYGGLRPATALQLELWGEGEGGAPMGPEDGAPAAGRTHDLVDQAFLIGVILSAGCLSIFASLPLFLFGVLIAAYVAFKITAPAPDGRESEAPPR